VKILVADDDPDLRALISFTLSQGGFEVCVADNGRTALDQFEIEDPNLLVVDLNMPHIDGFEVCRTVRQRSKIPVMVLTVRDSEDDLVTAFDCGADDYVRKPFSPRTLLARVRALARRAEAIPAGVIEVSDARLDMEQHTLQIGSTPAIHVTPLELKALQLLVQNAGRTVTAERLLGHIWGRASDRERRTLKQLIYRLRQKIELDPTAPEILQTTPGSGYKLIVERTMQSASN
jgi:DNA-binding response OmpR family regulator